MYEHHCLCQWYCSVYFLRGHKIEISYYKYFSLYFPICWCQLLLIMLFCCSWVRRSTDDCSQIVRGFHCSSLKNVRAYEMDFLWLCFHPSSSLFWTNAVLVFEFGYSTCTLLLPRELGDFFIMPDQVTFSTYARNSVLQNMSVLLWKCRWATPAGHCCFLLVFFYAWPL